MLTSYSDNRSDLISLFFFLFVFFFFLFTFFGYLYDREGKLREESVSLIVVT